MSLVHNMVGGGGINDAFAAIHVTYPSGSVCTCTKGSKVLTAKDTSGSYIFLVPEAGTWVVSCTDGTHTQTKNAVITEQYQTAEVILVFENVIYDRGNQYTDKTGGWRSYPTPILAGWTKVDAAFNTNNIVLSLPNSTNRSCAIDTNNEVDVTDYKTLYIDAEFSRTPSSGSIRLQLRSKNNGYYEDSDGKVAQSGTTDLDISGISGWYYILFGIHESNNPINVTISKIWME